MPESKPLAGKVSLVTGAARGIGRGIALGLAEAGSDVVVSDLEGGGAGLSYALSDKSDLESVAREVAEFDVRSFAVACDVTQKAQAEAAVARAVETFGGLDIVVNNAGVVHFEPMETFEESRWDLLFDVNVKGVFLVSQAAIPELTRRAGCIVNIASVAGKRGYPAGSAYCGTKFAVVGITQSLAAELGPVGVRVNAVCPGILDTAMWSDHLSDLMGADEGKAGRDAFDSAVGNFIPLGREQTPEDIAQAVVYLACAPNVSGISLNVAGGMEGW